jgi:hypothetical protein
MPGGQPPPQKSKSKGPLIAALVGAAVLIALIVGIALVAGGGDDDETTIDITTTIEDDADDPTTTIDDEDDGSGSDLDLEVPAGFIPFVSEEEGFAMALPETWEEFDLSDPDAIAALDDFAANNPAFGPVLDQAEQMLASGGVLFAFDPSQVEFAPNVNVLSFPGEAPIDELEQSVEGQLEPLGATNITTQIVDTDWGEGLVVEYDITITGPDGSPVDAHGIQFQLPASGSTWAVTMTTNDISRDGETFATMLDSVVVA